MSTKNYPICYLIMPMAKEFEELQDLVIKPLLYEQGVTTLSINQLAMSSVVPKDIFTLIDKSDFVIVDFSSWTANTLVEIGYTIAHDIPIIILSQSTDRIPFDLRNWQVLLYDYTPLGIEQLKFKLGNVVQRILETKLSLPSNVPQKNGSRPS